MSKNLSDAAIQQFDDMVKHAYQEEGGALRKTIRTKTGVVGNQHKFPTMGKGMATARIPQTDVVPMNITHAKKTATLGDWNAPEYTDIFDQQKTNVDEKRELASVIAQAIMRREDQMILDAFDAASSSLTIDTDIGGSDTNLNTAKFREARKLHSANGVSKMDRYLITHSNNLYGLLGDSDANTFDKNAVKALVDGEITKWLGYQVIEIGDYDEGGLPIAGSVRKNYFYHGGNRGSTGIAVGIDRKTEINYIAEKTSWLCNGLFSAGAVAIDAGGIVEADVTE
jgi:hypothetical protein